MDVKVVGIGCRRCEQLKRNTRDALDQLGLKDVEVGQIKEIEDIANLGPIVTPALMIDG